MERHFIVSLNFSFYKYIHILGGGEKKYYKFWMKYFLEIAL